jgi:hypothetical protein
MTSNTIVQKLWNYRNILRDDGLSYQDYIEQLTFLLFLKMADERQNVRRRGALGKLLCLPSSFQATLGFQNDLLAIALFQSLVFQPITDQMASCGSCVRALEILRFTRLGSLLEARGPRPPYKLVGADSTLVGEKTVFGRSLERNEETAQQRLTLIERHGKGANARAFDALRC